MTVRVLLVNSWHDDNKGDSAITIGTIGLIRKAFAGRGVHAEITVMGLNERGILTDSATRHVTTEWPDVTAMPCVVPTELGSRDTVRPLIDTPAWLARLTPWAVRSVRGRAQPGLHEMMRNVDLVVVVGGSSLYSDSAVNPLMSLARLYSLSLPVRSAAAAGKPVILLGHTLGPFPPRRALTKRVARTMLGTADIAVVREKRSVEVAHELGIRRVELAADLAFTLEPRETDRVRGIIETRFPHPQRCIAIAARQHPSLGRGAADRLISELSAAVRKLAALDLCDAVMVTAHTLGPTAIENDDVISVHLAERLRRECPSVTVHYLREDLSPGELAWLYGQMGGVIAVRLHAAILAMLSGTPTFAISYFTHKTEGVMDAAGLGDCVGDFATVTAEHIVEALRDRVGSPEARATLAKTSRANREHLESLCGDLLNELAGDSATAVRRDWLA